MDEYSCLIEIDNRHNRIITFDCGSTNKKPSEPKMAKKSMKDEICEIIGMILGCLIFVVFAAILTGTFLGLAVRICKWMSQ